MLTREVFTQDKQINGPRSKHEVKRHFEAFGQPQDKMRLDEKTSSFLKINRRFAKCMFTVQLYLESRLLLYFSF